MAITLFLVVVTLPALAPAVCSGPADETAVRDARDAIEESCPCATAVDARAYATCAKGVIDQRVGSGQLPRDCVATVRRCVRRSVCGRDDRVTCCRRAADRVRCRITRPGLCAVSGGCVGTFPSCCDACGPAGCCGNGIIDPGEQCDGEVFCGDSCFLPIYACCELTVEDRVCSREFRPEPGPPSCLEEGSTTYLGTHAPVGALCETGSPYGFFGEGPCGPVTTFAPTEFCCQRGPCFGTDVLSDSAQLVGWLLTSCDEGQGFHPAVVGTCGPDYQCHPAH